MSTPTAPTPKISAGGKPIATPPQTPSSPSTSTAPNRVDTLLFWLDWAIKVLGIAAAVIFGIWAPLSYQATDNANASGDAAQNSMISAAFAANSQASSALSIQDSALSAQSSAAAKQSVALDALNSRIGAIGQLWLLDFCLGNTALAACKSFTSEVAITSLVSYLASPTPTETTSATSSASSSSTPTSSASSTRTPATSTSRATLSLPAILGIVFAVILFLGLITGIFVSRLKISRHRRYEEE